MVINFMSNNNSIMRPFVIGSNVVERVTSYKLVGVELSEDHKYYLKHEQQTVFYQIV